MTKPFVTPDGPRARGEMQLRYEDVAQDGRLMLGALSHGLGEIVWRKTLENHAGSVTLRESGVVPILTRIRFEGGGGPLSIARPLALEGGFSLAHAVTASGEVDRIFIDMWLEATGVRARLYGPPPSRAGEPVLAGRLYAEHVFTRLFAAPEDRKVLRLDGPGLPGVPEARREWSPPASVATIPAGATVLGELRPDDALVCFGLAHTDSNLHVNSLVYPRLFEDAALRRFAALGETTVVLAREVEIAYRKPCFAGETMAIVVQAFRHEGRLGAIGAFVKPEVASAGGADVFARAHAYVCCMFEPPASD